MVNIKPDVLEKWRKQRAIKDDVEALIQSRKPSVDLIRQLIDLMGQTGDDDEWLHSTEDTMHRWVLEAIAMGMCVDPMGCAGAVLKTADLDFARWCV